MRKFLLLFSVACLSIGNSYGQLFNYTFTTPTSFTQIVECIERDSDYRLIFTNDILDQIAPIVLSPGQRNIHQLLQHCLQNQPVIFQVQGRYIVLRQLINGNSKSFNVRGIITNQFGEKAAGLTIMINGGELFTTTNSAGEFVVRNVISGTRLSISGAEVETTVLFITDDRELHLVVYSLVSTLDAPVLKGYYRTSRRYNTGSASHVSFDSIFYVNVSHPLMSVQGRIPGILVTSSSGFPNNKPALQLRGRNSIMSGNDPYILVDGFPLLYNNSSQIAAGSESWIDLPVLLNTGDIESIEVLKDADATAIYGSKGANGIILLTTRKPMPGKLRVRASVVSGLATTGRRPHYMNSKEYIQMRTNAFRNDQVVPDVLNAKDLVAYDTSRNTDLQKLLTGRTPAIQSAAVHINSGTDRVAITSGVQLYREGSFFTRRFFQTRFTAYLKALIHSQDQKTVVSFQSLSALANILNLVNDPGNLFALPPTIPPLANQDGTLNWSYGNVAFFNPLSVLVNTSRQHSVMSQAQVYFQHHFSRFISFNTRIGFSNFHYRKVNRIPIASQDPRFSPTGSLHVQSTSGIQWMFEPQLEYNKTYNKDHVINALAGITINRSLSGDLGISYNGFSADVLLDNPATAAAIRATHSEHYYRYAAIFSRIYYSYRKKYLVNLTLRRDGSSRYGPRYRYANFGAIGAAWIISDESFHDKIRKWVPFAKLRLSTGSAGNDQIEDYRYLATYNLITLAGQGLSIRPSSLANENYHWELALKQEYALELGFLDNRLLFEMNTYRHHAKQQIIYQPIASQTGYNTILNNSSASVLNCGWELQLSWQEKKTRNFNWSAGIYMYKNRNRLNSFPEVALEPYGSQYMVGYPLNMLKGFRFAGIDPVTGLYQVNDINHDGILNSSDTHFAGTTDPKWCGGIQFQLRRKNFSWSLVMEWRDQQGYDPVFSSGNTPGTMYNQLSESAMKKYNHISQRYSQSLNAKQAFLLAAKSDAAFTNAMFLAVRSFVFNYSFKKNSRDDKYRIMLFLEGENMLMITRYPLHPEGDIHAMLAPSRKLLVGLRFN